MEDPRTKSARYGAEIMSGLVNLEDFGENSNLFPKFVELISLRMNVDPEGEYCPSEYIEVIKDFLLKFAKKVIQEKPQDLMHLLRYTVKLTTNLDSRGFLLYFKNLNRE